MSLVNKIAKYVFKDEKVDDVFIAKYKQSTYSI